eukprot:scaffold68142_cov64-Cyclotella_meneghiniana.AAC.2
MNGAHQDMETCTLILLNRAVSHLSSKKDTASAVVVPRIRFAPVKKCNDLLLLCSDAYIITKDFRSMLNPLCNGVAPIIDLDSKNYHNVSALEAATANGRPSLVACKRPKLKGVVHFDRSMRIVGCVSITNSNEESKYVSGVIEDEDIDMTAEPGLGLLKPTHVKTAPITGQKPGTSDLSNKTKEFVKQTGYLNKFAQGAMEPLFYYLMSI